LNQDFAYLFDLIRFREGVFGLKIEDLSHYWMSEDVVAAFDSLCEAEARKKTTEIRKTDVCVRGASPHV